MEFVQTKNTNLRRLRSDDLEKMRQLESDPLVMKFTSARRIQTEEQSKFRLGAQIAKQPSWEPFGIWLAEKKSDRSLVGWFMLIPEEFEQLELGFMLVRSYWGQGFATEIGHALIDYAFSHEAIKSLMATATPNNAASIRVLEKLGFRYIKNTFVDDKESEGRVDLRLFAIYK